MGKRSRIRRDTIAAYQALHDYLGGWVDHTAQEYQDDYFTGYNQAIIDVIGVLDDLANGRSVLEDGTLSETEN